MKRLSSLLRHDLVHNTLALYGVQACRKLLPLISIPYLARVLKPEGWGTVAFVSSMGDFVVLAIEYGFNLSATRELAKNRSSAERCGQIASSVVACQLLLAMAAAVVLLLVAPNIAVLRNNSDLLWAGLLYGVAQGLNPLWFFQGFENIPIAAGIEVTGKVLALIGLFIWVKSPSDAWIVLVLQAVPALLCTTAAFVLALRSVNLCLPRPADIVRTFRLGLPMFLFRSGESLYGVGNAFVLGLFASPASVGYFSMAERISRAVFGLTDPIREALFPRLSRLSEQSQQRAAQLARAGAGIMIFVGLALGIALYVFAPLLVRIAGSASFTPAVTVLRIFSPLPLLLAISHSVGVQWLFSLGRESVVTRVIIMAGLLNLALAVFLAPRFAHFGMAWSVVAAEVFVCISMIVNVSRISPFWKLSSGAPSGQSMSREWIGGSDSQPAPTLTHSH